VEVSPNTLRKEAVATLRSVDEDLQLSERDISPATRATLLLAKAQCLNTLTLLREQGRRK
jgi:hypothetical protein